MSFSSRLKQLRSEHHVSQAALAKLLGVTQQAVGKWEVDKSTPDYETLGNIAKHFQVSADYLIGLTDSPHGNFPSTTKPKTPVHTQREQNLLGIYRVLDEFGRQSVDITAKHEYSRVKATTKNKTEDAAM